jgi:hypothetical protein
MSDRDKEERAITWKDGLLPAGLTALAYAILELTFVAQRNLLLPWSGSHIPLGLTFFLLHALAAFCAVLGAGWIARRFFARRAPALPAFAPIFFLLMIHALTDYRERLNPIPRDLKGTLVTVGIAVVFAAAAFALAYAVRRSPRRGRSVSTAIAAAILGFALFQAVSARPLAEEGKAPALPPRPEEDRLHASDTGKRVFIFGFDGATWEVLDELITAGRMPNLAALAARGRMFDLETIRPTFSPIIWTSLATGKTRYQHGIHDVVQSVLPGNVVLPRSIERTAFLTKTAGVFFRFLNQHHLLRLSSYRSSQVRATSIFEAASEAGIPATQIEWYVTWPARLLSGVSVSDRFHLQAPGKEALPRAVYPDSTNADLRPQIVAPSQIPLEDVMWLTDTEGLEPEGKKAWANAHHSFIEEMRINLARDFTTRNVAVDLLTRDPAWRLFGVYFRAVDVSHHLAWKYRGAAGDEAVLRSNPELRLRTVVDRYHEIMDRIVGDVLARVPEDAVVIMLSDHGFEDRYGHSRAPTGFAIAAGAPVMPSAGRGRIGIYEIAPTMAFLLGLPIPQDLEAGPRTDVLDPMFVAAHSMAPVSTWEREGRWTGDDATMPGIGEAMDEEEIDRLRAIGYIQ